MTPKQKAATQRNWRIKQLRATAVLAQDWPYTTAFHFLIDHALRKMGADSITEHMLKEQQKFADRIAIMRAEILVQKFANQISPLKKSID